MSDIQAIHTSIKQLEAAREQKMRKLKEGIGDTMEHRRKQREAQRRPT